MRARLATGSLPAAFHAVAREAGARTALTIEGTSATYDELDGAAARVAAWLLERRIGPTDRVLLSGPNSLAFAMAYLAILRTGAIAVPVGAALTERELRQVVTASGATAAFAAGDALGRLRALADAGAGPAVVVSLERAARGPSVDDAARHAEPLPVPDLPPDYPAMLAYTSGTTGQPKGALLRHGNLLASLRGVALAWQWTPDDVLIHCLPLTHQHGLTGLQATLLTGARAVIHASLEPARLCGDLAAERASLLFAVPTIYERLLAWDEIADADFSSLRIATSGSAPLSSSLFERAQKLLGMAPLERYGTTETGLDISNLYDGERRPGTVGLPLPGVEVAIADDAGHAVADGTDGELLLRGPQVFSGYWDDEAATIRCFLPGGWFRTGDVARIDATDGSVSITGRIKELIISGGMNVSPREVELALEEQPGVDRAAVVGVASERWGEEVVGFVVPIPGRQLDPDAVRARAREALSPHKRPRAVFVTPELPLDALGKLQRPELADLAAQLSKEEP